MLVASFDEQSLRSAGIDILRRLWAHDISAELAVDANSADGLMARYKDDRHSWIVIVKPDTGGYGEKMLKVRSIVRKEDTEIRSSELMSWLRSEIRERDQRERTNDRAKFLRHSSGGGGSLADSPHLPSATNSAKDGGGGSAGGGGGGSGGGGGGGSGNGGGADGGSGGGGGGASQNVRVLISQPKGKKHYRRNVVEAAQARVQELVHGLLLDAPIAAVNVRDNVLDAMRGTALADPDSWRRLIRGAPQAERHYLTQVYELLGDIARDKKGVTRDAFIYNYRSGACIYYDLERPVERADR